ncbi:hypothetical protein NHH03_18345 [Stieleria sp. TO1_6]|uniref:anti-sigma factor family protein n=1 Tax=Stieleria tagensis TaxID=2956795 RepID=UPI00209B346F|nr:hypothetical protein [Stieleria tagensis]MCO8123712.1 hypothetical protein [Stieleria tagensis]
MALPDNLLDELLSAHLDGALSGDECARVEQMLNADPAIATRMEQLRQQRDAFRGAALPVPSLPQNFADQVVQAAIDQARAQQLPAGHPLQIAGRQESSQRAVLFPARLFPAKSSPARTRQIAGLVAALAASALIAGALIRSATIDHSDSSGSGLVAGGPSLERELTAPESQPAGADVDLAPGPDVSRPMLADSNSRSAIAAPTEIEVTDLPVPETVLPENPTPEMVANSVPAVAPDANSPIESPATVSVADPELKATPATPLQMLMVVQVIQTDAGRRDDAFGKALADVKIHSSNERQIDDALTRAVVADDGEPLLAGKQDGQVMLLESPVKKLDQLLNRLSSDRQGIQSVGFSLITEAPMLRAIESVRTIDPTEIRHEGQSSPLIGQTDQAFALWSQQLEDRTFANGAAEAISMAKGPNPMANLLILVK